MFLYKVDYKKEKLENFKVAISSTVKSLSNSPNIEVSFGNQISKNDQKFIKLPDLNILNSKLNYKEIRAIADKDKVVILAEAYKLSEQLRGEGDALSANIYAESFSQDPEFYEFTRSMKAYVETFESKSDVMLIDSDSEFFKYLNDKINKE